MNGAVAFVGLRRVVRIFKYAKVGNLNVCDDFYGF